MTSVVGAQDFVNSSAAQIQNAAQEKADRLIVRDALETDIPAIQAIYQHHVLNGTATFEETPPTVDEMRARRSSVLNAGLPYLVAIQGTDVAGYCYAAQYRPRVAYRFTIEDSIYLSPRYSGKGVGTALLTELIKRCEQGPWRQMIAVIAGQENRGSIALHRRLGFGDAGVQPATGFKFGKWIDVVFMQRALGEGSSTSPIPPSQEPTS